MNLHASAEPGQGPAKEAAAKANGGDSTAGAVNSARTSIVPAENTAAGRSARSSLVRRLVERRLSGLIAAIAIAVIIFESQNHYFLTSRNILGLLRGMSSLAIVACGQTLVLVAGELDLSVGSVYGLGAMVTAILWTNGLPVSLALLAGLAAGAIAGLINALATTILKVPSFVATLGMLSLASGLTFLVSNSQSINATNTTPGYAFFNRLSNASLPFSTPAQILWLAGVAVVTGFLLQRTVFGFRVSAIGGNLTAAKNAALPVRSYKIWVFCISGTLASLAGILDFSLIGSTTPTAGDSLTFPVFAAVIIGGASLVGGRGTIAGTIAGALLLEVLSNGLSLLGVGAYAQLIFTGLATILAAALNRWTAARAAAAGNGTVQF